MRSSIAVSKRNIGYKNEERMANRRGITYYRECKDGEAV